MGGKISHSSPASDFQSVQPGCLTPQLRGYSDNLELIDSLETLEKVPSRAKSESPKKSKCFTYPENSELDNNTQASSEESPLQNPLKDVHLSGLQNAQNLLSETSECKKSIAPKKKKTPKKASRKQKNKIGNGKKIESNRKEKRRLIEKRINSRSKSKSKRSENDTQKQAEKNQNTIKTIVNTDCEKSKENEVIESCTLKLIKPCFANMPRSDFISALNREISLYVCECDQYMKLMEPFCLSARAKLENLAKSVFPRRHYHDIKALIYGSMATGMALPESDLDILISGLQLYSREEMISSIELFANELRKNNWVCECQDIISARVPVIKLIIDLEKISNKISLSKKFHVDVTFDMSTENSYLPAPYPILCADLIKYRINENAYLKPMTIMLKKLLKSSGLNNSFLGDISSYGLNFMVSAFLRMCPNSPTKGECFMELLHYYGAVFKSSEMMIVNGDYVMLMPVQVQKDCLVITDPFKPGINAAANVTRFGKLQECVKNVWEKLKELRKDWESGLKNEDEIKKIIF